MQDNQTSLIAKLTPNEFMNLTNSVFSKYNQSYRLIAVKRNPGRKSVTVQLHTGIQVVVDVDNTSEDDGDDQ